MLVICCLGKFLLAQDTIHMNGEGKDFIGTWSAIQDSSIYEIYFQVCFIHDNTRKVSVEYIIGSIKKITNGKVDFFLKYDDRQKFFAPMLGKVEDSYHMNMYCEDMLVRRRGKLTFTLTDNRNRAIWKLEPDETNDLVSSIDLRPFKIPKELIFIRKNNFQQDN